ncbi:MAG: 3'(2'),5'-bisphosphate nucleotidase CysQ [Polyangiaceae bacterium]|nr:3'(2'),5'-bisphosphate nucleotidase CysQ [Polyangiaceae bacterium]
MAGAREIEEMLRIARAAASIVLEVYATPFEVELKGPGDPVTLADRRANALICRELERSFPGEAILAEESVPEDPAEIAARAARERVFFVDPLDGTREFADRNGEFAVMIGLAERGRAAAGVVVIPATGAALVGRGGSGSPDGALRPIPPGLAAAPASAFLEDAGGARRPLRTSSVTDPSLATAVVSRSHRPRAVQPMLDRLGVTRVVPCGSVGVKVARVVTGAADLYVHSGPGAKLWDSCAPEAILEAAGGRFTDLAGDPITYARADLGLSNGLIATNGPLHANVVAAARAALA